MIDSISLLTIGLAFLVVAASPGPANLSNATIAMSKGRKTSLVYGFGLSTGLLFWGVVAASGLGVVLQSSVYLLSILKLLGGLYLVWLAYQSFKSSIANTAATEKEVSVNLSYKKWFFRGLLLNVSNPKTVVAWMAALSVGMDKYSDIYSLVMAVFVCMCVGFFVNATYSMLFSIQGEMSWYRKMGHYVQGVASALFALAGGAMIHSVFSKTKESL